MSRANIEEQLFSIQTQRGKKTITDRQEQVDRRLNQMPKQYQAVYRRAMSGKSRKAAMHAFCAECFGWEIREVFLCSDTGCPLYPYRPRSRISQGTPESNPEAIELKKLELFV